MDTITIKNHVLQKMQYRPRDNPSPQGDSVFLILDNIKQKSQDKLIITSDIYGPDNILLRPGDQVDITFLQAFQCTLCQKPTKKLVRGFCYLCFTRKAAADFCVLNPHKCHFAQGTCREPQWGLDFCFQPHFVYLAYTDKFKVGITRESHVPTRWWDQGATRAALLARVASRRDAGLVEQELAALVGDKTHWQNMIKNANAGPTDAEFRDCFDRLIHTPLRTPVTFYDHAALVELAYPIDAAHMPPKLTSLSLDKTSHIGGEITAIKGQYLCFGDKVFNVRSHEGYVVDYKYHAGDRSL